MESPGLSRTDVRMPSVMTSTLGTWVPRGRGGVCTSVVEFGRAFVDSHARPRALEQRRERPIPVVAGRAVNGGHTCAGIRAPDSLKPVGPALQQAICDASWPDTPSTRLVAGDRAADRAGVQRKTGPLWRLPGALARPRSKADPLESRRRYGRVWERRLSSQSPASRIEDPRALPDCGRAADWK